MAQWFFDPFARSRVFGATTAASTTIPLRPTHGLRFADAPAQIAIWNATLWETWEEAFYEPGGQVEIVTQTVPAVGDQLQGVVRAQMGTTALDMTDTTQRYRVEHVQTSFIVGTEVNAGKLLATVDGVELEAGLLVIGDGAWDGEHITMGAFHIWLDSAGDIRLKNGAPLSDMDGSVIGGAGGGANLQAAYDAATTPPQIDINATPDPVTIDASVAGDVFAVRDASSGDIVRFATDRVEIGQTVLQSGSLSVATPNAYTFSDTFTTGAGYVGGAIRSDGTVTYNNAVFIWALLSENKRYEAAASPGFAAFTLFNALPIIANAGNFNLVGAITLNSGVVHERTTSGTSVATNMITVSAANQTRALVSGAVMSRTVQIGLAISPTFSTVVGSTANLGTIIGVQCNNPGAALFQPQTGVEGMTAYYGLVMNNITFGGNVTKAAILSGLAAATNAYVILNTGTAQSDFGAGSAHWDDNAGVQLGGLTNAAHDVLLNWNGITFEMAFAENSGNLTFRNVGADRFLVNSTTGISELNINCGGGFSLGAQVGANGNQFGNFVFGASATQLAGEYSQFLLTQAANLTIDHAMGGVFGWTVNAPSLTAGTGSVTTAAAMNIGGNVGLATVNRVGLRIISNPSGGSGVNAALWITAGLSRFDGRVDINNGIALGGGAAPTLGTIGGAGPTAAAQAQWLEVDIGGTAHWIPVWV